MLDAILFQIFRHIHCDWHFCLVPVRCRDTAYMVRSLGTLWNVGNEAVQPQPAYRRREDGQSDQGLR